MSKEEILINKISKNFDKRLALLEKEMEKPQPKLKEKGRAEVGKEQVSKPSDDKVLERTLQILAKYSNTTLGEIKKQRKDK